MALQNKLVTSYLKWPHGFLAISANDIGLTKVEFVRSKIERDSGRGNPHIVEAKVQLLEYFRGLRTQFRLRLAVRGTPFQRSVWQVLAQIPYGVTVSYGDIAKMVGKPKAARAVGMANNRNPIPIIIPCHRVVGKGGDLVGFGGGLPIKKWLLTLENQD